MSFKNKFKKPVILIGQSEGAQTVVYFQKLYGSADVMIIQGSNFGTLEELLDYQKDKAAKAFIQGLPQTKKDYPYLTALYQSMYRKKFLKIITDSDLEISIVQSGDWQCPTNIKNIDSMVRLNRLIYLRR